MLDRISLFVLAVTTLTCGLACPVLAAPDQVGLAVIVRNNVSEVEPKPAKISTGDDVVRDEIIQTMADSHAKVVLKDSTNLVLGPNSTLKLDRTVFTDATSIGDIAIKLTTAPSVSLREIPPRRPMRSRRRSPRSASAEQCSIFLSNLSRIRLF